MCRPRRKPLADVATIVHNLLQKHNWGFSSRKITFDLDADLEMTLRFLSGVSMVMTGFTSGRFSNWWITRHRIRYRCLWTSKSFCICTLCCPKDMMWERWEKWYWEMFIHIPRFNFLQKVQTVFIWMEKFIEKLSLDPVSNWTKVSSTQSLIFNIKIQPKSDKNEWKWTIKDDIDIWSSHKGQMDVPKTSIYR